MCVLGVGGLKMISEARKVEENVKGGGGSASEFYTAL